MFLSRISPSSLTLSLLVISKNIFVNAETDALFSASLHSLSSTLSPTLNGEFLLPVGKAAAFIPCISRHSVHPLPSPVPFQPWLSDNLDPVKELDAFGKITSHGINSPQKMAHESEADEHIVSVLRDSSSEDRRDGVAPYSLNDFHLSPPEPRFTLLGRKASELVDAPTPIPSTPPQFTPPAYLHGLEIKEHVETC